MKPTEQAGGLSALPTQPANLTQEGAILGTFQYMAPEQLEGQEADARTDIFAFGAVVYEMVTGRKAFEGKSQASLISAIMTTDPPALSSLQAISPPALDQIVMTCLAKGREKRWQAAGDIARQLQWLTEAGSPVNARAEVTTQPTGWRRPVPLFVTPVGAVVAVLVGAMIWSPGETMDHPTSLSVTLPVEQRLAGPFPITLSPDGTLLVYAAESGEESSLYLRPLERFEATRIPGTDGGTAPFFSRDGESIGFIANHQLKTVSLTGGLPLTLGEGENLATWGSDDTIIYSAPGGLRAVSAYGGEPEVLTSLDYADGGYFHVYPQLLPDGDTVLFAVWGGAGNQLRAAVLSLATKEWRPMLSNASGAWYIPTGHLVFFSAGSERQLVARAFDLQRLSPGGASVGVLEDARSPSGAYRHDIAASQTGTLAYVWGGGDDQEQLVWVDHSGRAEPLDVSPDDFVKPNLSPDGRRIAFESGDGPIHVIDVERPTRRTIIQEVVDEIDQVSNDSEPVWTPDGVSLTFGSNRAGDWDIYTVPADGSSEE